MSEAEDLARSICGSMLRGEVLSTALGRWFLDRRCVFMSHPRRPPPGEPERDPTGRPRFNCGHWLVPFFLASRALRGAVRDPEAPLEGWSDWEAAAIAALRAGHPVQVPGAGRMEVYQGRQQLLVRFSFCDDLRREIGAAHDRLLGGPPSP